MATALFILLGWLVLAGGAGAVMVRVCRSASYEDRHRRYGDESGSLASLRTVAGEQVLERPTAR